MQQMLMLNNRPQDIYRKQDILTASPVDLIIMLYDALKRNIIMGKRSITNKDVPGAHKHLMKAQMILTELINSLDMSYQISEELLDLYEFALKSIADANMHKDTEPLGPVIEMIDEIRGAWKEIGSANRGMLENNIEA
ncbi:MAG: flagellar export chaperone FliS [Oscillospiraceae bacterium]|nr:flagellar export chaperone FliS [Oscillospiraceae bacterium]